jgi:hypothetical protein
MARVFGGILTVAIVGSLFATAASGALILRLRQPGQDLYAPNPEVPVDDGAVINFELWAIITEDGAGTPAASGALATAIAGVMSSDGGVALGTTTLMPAGDVSTMFSTAATDADLHGDGDTDAVGMNWAANDFLDGSPGVEHLIGQGTFTVETMLSGGTTYLVPTLHGATDSQWKENGSGLLFGQPTVEEPEVAGITLTPEPATLALVGLGLAAIASRKRK